MAHLVGGHAGQSGLHLIGDELHGHAQLTLLQALAHADDGVQAGLQGGVDLLVDGEVGLVVVLTALRVADDDVLHAQLLEHLGGNLAGVGAVGLIVAVLSADGDAAVLEQTHSGGNVHVGHAENDLAPLGLAQLGLDVLGEGLGLGQGLVHLPVAGDDGLAVAAVHCSSILSIYVRLCAGGAPVSSRPIKQACFMPGWKNLRRPAGRPRRSKLCISRFRPRAKAQSLRCSSSPHRTRFAGLRRGPRKGVACPGIVFRSLRRPAGRQRRAAPCPP